MPRVSVKSSQQAKSADLPEGCSGSAKATAYFANPRQPLHLYLMEIGAGDTLRMESGAVDRVAYVWKGGIKAGGYLLEQGSSLIVEHGGTLDILGSAEVSLLTVFSAATSSGRPRPGGNIHLLPADQVPRSDKLGGVDWLGGAMHADADCPTCEMWLHENHFHGRQGEQPGAEARIHSHTEDEIIFVIDGEMRLGGKHCGPGTALAIAADTLYGFTAGPKGLRFINFRAATPGDIRFAGRPSIAETEYWRERLPRPRYFVPRAEGAP